VTKDPSKKPSTPESEAEEAQAVEAMRKAAEAEPRVLTPEEEAAEAEAARNYIAKFRPHHVETPIYKPPM
jgi:hypothetical protein